MRNAKQEDLIGLTAKNCPYDVMFYVADEGLVHRKHLYNDWCLEHPDKWVLAEKADGSSCVILNPETQFLAVPMKKQSQKKRKKHKRPCNGVDYLEKIPFEYSKVKVGDKVQLRNGSIETIYITDDGGKYPIQTYDNGGMFAGYWYTVEGAAAGLQGCSNEEEILYILRKTKKSVPKTEQNKDEFRFVNESTGQEIVFSRDELQLISELVGSIAERTDTTRYQSPGLKQFSNHSLYRKLRDAGATSERKFTNNIVLRPDTPTPIYKE